FGRTVAGAVDVAGANRHAAEASSLPQQLAIGTVISDKAVTDGSTGVHDHHVFDHQWRAGHGPDDVERLTVLLQAVGRERVDIPARLAGGEIGAVEVTEGADGVHVTAGYERGRAGTDATHRFGEPAGVLEDPALVAGVNVVADDRFVRAALFDRDC